MTAKCAEKSPNPTRTRPSFGPLYLLTVLGRDLEQIIAAFSKELDTRSQL